VPEANGHSFVSANGPSIRPARDFETASGACAITHCDRDWRGELELRLRA
jgi:hypothetical protein